MVLCAKSVFITSQQRLRGGGIFVIFLITAKVVSTQYCFTPENKLSHIYFTLLEQRLLQNLVSCLAKTTLFGHPQARGSLTRSRPCDGHTGGNIRHLLRSTR